MSRFFGWWHLDGRPIDTRSFHRCLSVLALPTPDAETLTGWVDGPIGLSHAPCVFDGRIDDRDRLARLLHDHPAVRPGCRDRVLIAAAYDRFGDGFIDHLAGDFALGIFDRVRRRLVLARDRTGVRPLCFARTDAALLFSTDAKAILAHPDIASDPDETMLADFVLYFLGADSQTRTFFRHVRAVPPAHLLVATPEGVELRRYFDFDTTARVRCRDVREYGDGLRERVTASVRNRIRSDSPVAVSVSGGLDSSFIYCTAQRLVREAPGVCPAVVGVSCGGPPGTPSDEAHYVDAIERQYGTRIARLDERTGFLDEAAAEVWHSESPRIDRLARQGAMIRGAAYAAGARRLLTGHWGDQVFSSWDYLLDLLQGGQWSLLRRHAARWRVGARGLAVRFGRDTLFPHVPGSIKSMLRTVRRVDAAWHWPVFTPRFRQLLRERSEAPRLARPGGTRHAWAIYQQARRPYHVQCLEWNVRVGAIQLLDVAFPYFDCDLLQFVMSIPGEILSHDGVARGLMRHAMRGIVPDAIADRRTKGEFTHIGRRSVDEEFAAIRRLLAIDALSVQFGYVEGSALQQALDDWRPAIQCADDSILARRVADLCGLELFLRRFCAHEEALSAMEAVVSCG